MLAKKWKIDVEKEDGIFLFAVGGSSEKKNSQ